MWRFDHASGDVEVVRYVGASPHLYGEPDLGEFVENYLHDTSDQVVTGDLDAGNWVFFALAAVVSLLGGSRHGSTP
ncbi:MAG: hypothetical protein M0008_08010 [Actinomycetota bacterium]|nr:hypothetical protein [Actinomycetota bacterium]